MIAADPERHRICRVVHLHAPDVRRVGKQVFREPAGPGIKRARGESGAGIRDGFVSRHERPFGHSAIIADHLHGSPSAPHTATARQGRAKNRWPSVRRPEEHDPAAQTCAAGSRTKP